MHTDFFTFEQHWRDLLFMSWRLPPDVVRPLVPEMLELDLLDGEIWVSMVAMRIRGIRIYQVPQPPGMDRLFELNLRTYVRYGDQAGVYFFTIDCDKHYLSFLGKHLLDLPIYPAVFDDDLKGEPKRYDVTRIDDDAAGPSFTVSFSVDDTPIASPSGSLEDVLLNRLLMISVDRNGQVHSGKIDHPAWDLYGADVTIERNQIAEVAGLRLAAQPDHVCYSPGIVTTLWPSAPMAAAETTSP